jgi:hypothetical protein
VLHSLKDNERWNRKPLSIDGLDNCNPFSIAWLYCPRLSGPVGSCNDSRSRNDAHLEASFVEIVDIVIKNPVENLCILKAYKLGTNKYRVLALSTLVVVLAIVLRF